jgi:hypothetical protein
MTIAYVPGAEIGEWAVRATSLVLFGLTGLACAGVARRRVLPLPGAAALLLFAQPLAARIAFSALPYTIFSLVLAVALWLRAQNRHAAAALVVALLPLARLEGLVVLAVWGLVLLFERRFKVIPLLAAGMVGWAALGGIVHQDALWIVHSSPYGLLNSRFPRAGWTFVLHAFPIAVGPVVGGLVFLALGGRSPRVGDATDARDASDVLPGVLAFALPAFYAVAWGIGAFQTGPAPVYLVSASVPFALCAHRVVVALLEDARPARPWGTALAVVAAVVVFADNPRPVTAALLAVTVAGAALLVRPAIFRALRPAAAGLVIAAAVLAMIAILRPLPLQGSPKLSKDLSARLGARANNVVLWTDPAFGWFSGRGHAPRLDRPGTVPRGKLLLWESDIGGRYVVSEARLRRLGFRPIASSSSDGVRQILWRRVS